MLNAEQEREIQALREQTAPTRRTVVPALEEILYQPLPVLDHGFVRVVDYMGDDAAVVRHARRLGVVACDPVVEGVHFAGGGGVQVFPGAGGAPVAGAPLAATSV